MLKRSFDVLASVALLLASILPMLIIALAVKVTSRGPVIFKQERIGRNNIPFIILKFRTMKIGSEKSSAMVIKGDKRITWVGRLLRPLYLDELPQLINVLKGEMSLVGPRPRTAYEIHLRSEKFPDFSQRHRVRPGITGPAQVLGRVLTDEDVARGASLDLAYAEEHSFLGDMHIIMKTIPMILKRKGI